MNQLNGPNRLNRLTDLTVRTNVGRSLADDDAFDRLPATGARRAGAAEHLELILIASCAVCDGIEVGFAGSQAGAQVLQTTFEDAGNRATKGLDLDIGEGV